MMSKLAQLEQCLSSLCAPEDSNVVLWFSGGADSTLLLETLISEKLAFSILRFDDGWSRAQKRIVDEIILKHNLRVYSYPPASGVLLGNGEGELTLACNYAVGKNGERTAIFRDLVPGDKCAFDINVQMSDRIRPPVIFDTHLVGTKKGETHFVANGRPLIKGKQWFIGGVKFVAPLWDFDDSEVLQALKDMKVEYEPPANDARDLGNISACSLCLQPSPTGDVYCPKKQDKIPVVAWDQVANLQQWREQHGIAR